MNIEVLDINEVLQHPQNVRVHSKKNLDIIKNSLQEFGQTKPILVQKSTMYVIAGNGTLQAAKALGWTQIQAHILDLDDNKANALAILDNKSTDESQWDEKGLTELLQQLNEQDNDLLNLTGFATEDLDSMLKFQTGQLFEDKKPKEKKEKQQKEEKSVIEELTNVAVSYDDQVSFVLMGFPYVCDDKEQIQELKCLTELLKDADKDVKDDVTKHIFDVIQEVLTSQFLRAE